MANITSYDQKFEAPAWFDPANLALITQRIAEQFDDTLDPLQWWDDFLTVDNLSEVGTTVIYRQASADQTNYLTSTEKGVLFDTTVFDNTGTMSGNNDLIIPDQDQRYWWYMGVNLFSAAMDLNVRMTGRLYVQDRDPATGQVYSNISRYNWYMRSESDQYFTWDGLFRSGGGRQRVTFSHGSAAAVSLRAGCSVWAVRICPDR